MSKDDSSNPVDNIEKVKESIRALEKVRANLSRAHQEMANREIIGEARGLVTITMNGRREVLHVDITEEALAQSKKELEQLLRSAFNDARKKVEQAWMFEAAFSDKLNS